MTGLLEVAELVARAARAAPGVVDLHPGRMGEFATYGRGHRVNGVRVRPGPKEVTVRVVVEYGRPLLNLAEAVRGAVLAALSDQPGGCGAGLVHVEIAELRGHTEEDPG